MKKTTRLAAALTHERRLTRDALVETLKEAGMAPERMPAILGRFRYLLACHRDGCMQVELERVAAIRKIA